MTFDDFVKRVKENHGDKYEYIPWDGEKKWKDNIKYICQKHGEIEQTIDGHLVGRGCKYCSGNVKITQEEFERRVKEKHGNALDLSKAIYQGESKKVTAICPEHGEFEILPKSLYNGSGCPICDFIYSRVKYCISFWSLKDKHKKALAFIQKSKMIHGDEYDYSLVEEIDKSNEKVKIICKKHGVFEQSIQEHLSGKGCGKCGNNVRKTQKEFETEAKDAHGDSLDLSEAKYVDSKTKVTVICPKHGRFKINPQHLVRGSGCPTCEYLNTEGHPHNSFWKLLTPEERVPGVIEKFRSVHGDKYNYSRITRVESGSDEVEIICPEGHVFRQSVSVHSLGHGCPICSGVKKPTQEEFSKIIHDIYGDNIILDKTKYVNYDTKVIITCKDHGDFDVSPSEIYEGRACPVCCFLKNKQSSTFWNLPAKRKTKYIIEKLKTIHNNKYSYDYVREINGRFDEIEITCPVHGNYKQLLVNHLAGKGCQNCRESKLESSLAKYLSDNGFIVERYKKFDWLGLQSLDVYLPELNIGIECQGPQHFRPIDYFDGMKGFEYRRERDIKKYNLCKENGIKLLYLMPKEKVSFDFVHEIQEIYTEENVCRTLDELLQKIREAE